MSSDHVPPNPDEGSFHCPHCEIYSRQYSHTLKVSQFQRESVLAGSNIRECENCSNYTIWLDGEMIYPRSSTAPRAHSEMPEDVARDYNEARNVFTDSPRASAALLRLAIERLTGHLDANGDRLYERIGDLVENDEIDERVQRAFDSVRVAGNESVHAGEVIDVDRDPQTASVLFEIVNIIVEETIARDQRIEEMYDQLSDGQRRGIENRDS